MKKGITMTIDIEYTRDTEKNVFKRKIRVPYRISNDIRYFDVESKEVPLTRLVGTTNNELARNCWFCERKCLRYNTMIVGCKNHTSLSDKLKRKILYFRKEVRAEQAEDPTAANGIIFE